MKAIIIGGGTGGHVFPAKAIAERLIEDLCARGYCLCGNKEIGDKKSKAWTNLQKENLK